MYMYVKLFCAYDTALTPLRQKVGLQLTVWVHSAPVFSCIVYRISNLQKMYSSREGKYSVFTYNTVYGVNCHILLWCMYARQVYFLTMRIDLTKRACRSNKATTWNLKLTEISVVILYIASEHIAQVTLMWQKIRHFLKTVLIMYSIRVLPENKTQTYDRIWPRCRKLTPTSRSSF